MASSGLATSLMMERGSIPCSALYSAWMVRRRLVSASARCIDPVILVGIEDGPAVEVARRPADGLDQRGLGAQEALLIRVEHRHQRDLGQIEAFAQEVDPHQHVELAAAEIGEDGDALEGVDLRVQIADPHPDLGEIGGQILGHPLGQGRHQHPFTARDHGADLGEQIVDLVLRRPHLDLGIEQPGGPDHLLHDLALAVLELVGSRGRGHEDRLVDPLLELLEHQRPVVEGRRQPEAEVDQGLLARAVAVVHPADLRNRDVGLVGDEQEVLREVVEEGRRRLARRPPGEVARVVLDPLAVAELGEHFEIEEGALRQPLRLEELLLAVEFGEPLIELVADPVDGLEQILARGHIVGPGVDGQTVEVSSTLPRTGSIRSMVSTSSPQNEIRTAVSS